MKKMNNKGFSLVELIIVIAIMAILIAVLAPQYLRYVEKSRLQSDNSTIGEVANAVKVAAANESVASDIQAASAGVTITVPKSAGSVTVTGTTATTLADEITNTCGDNIQLKSNTYSAAVTLTATYNTSIKGITVVCNNYWKDGATAATTINF